ncbi:hypothetical protein F383_11451 [Gossypium arboreum]|uniref:Uncharacterized protein n=1 Tax=Gossypium arboreum TaxID=29729 RepID=A0A0B0PSJ7_GOSAR|nr:hypothetical protein F383_33352 [Gossypium arboreum]KHG28010.1 hypothetical protein F383_11451 [Gossypium arboreum]
MGRDTSFGILSIRKPERFLRRSHCMPSKSTSLQSLISKVLRPVRCCRHSSSV